MEEQQSVRFSSAGKPPTANPRLRACAPSRDLNKNGSLIMVVVCKTVNQERAQKGSFGARLNWLRFPPEIFRPDDHRVSPPVGPLLLARLGAFDHCLAVRSTPLCGAGILSTGACRRCPFLQRVSRGFCGTRRFSATSAAFGAR